MLKHDNSAAYNAPSRYLLLACEVLHRECALCVSRSPSVIDLEYLSQGYHDLPSEEMCRLLQERIDQASSAAYDAVLLGFALCNNGISGLRANNLPLVIPRAHDCITLLLGSRKRYDEYFREHPGTYYLSSGWLERDETEGQELGLTVMGQLGLDKSYAEMVREYGEENAAYLMETIGGGLEKHYDTIAFINTGVGPIENYRHYAMTEADRRSFSFFELQGDLSLIQSLCDGAWQDDFLVLAPGESVSPSYDNEILCTRC